jgi:RNA polymerase sigma-70 factor (sigma-E family)
VRVSPGDPPTFEDFAAAELPRLLGLARALTPNGHDAWDLVNDTLAKASLRWRSIERGSNPTAYVRTMMVRLNIDRVRRLRREWLTSDPPEQVYEDVLPIGVEPWLADAMAALTARQRTAITLRFVHDLDVAGIAREMDCSVGTAKSHLSRALAELRKRAREHAGDLLVGEGERDG